MRNASMVVMAACAAIGLCVSAQADPVRTGALFSAVEFAQTFAQQMEGHFDRQIEPLERQRNQLRVERGDAEQAGRAEIDRQIDDLNRRIDDLEQRKKDVRGSELGWEIFQYAKRFHDVLTDVEAGLDQTDTYYQRIVGVEELVADELVELAPLLEQVTQGVGHLERIQNIGEALSEADGLVCTPHNKRMLAAMYGLFTVLEQFGDDVPLPPVMGTFLTTYGDVGKAMISATGRLDQRIAQRAQGLLIPGYPDDGRTEAFNQLPFGWDLDLMEFRRLPGVRDAYALGDGSEVILWDPRYRRWHRAGREMTAKEVLRRYAFFASYGDPNPTPNQILMSAGSVVGARLEPAQSVVAPGGSTSILVIAEQLDGQVPARMHFALKSRVQTTVRAALGFADDHGQFHPDVVSTDERLDAVWTAPDRENHVYTITAELIGERPVDILIGNPSCQVATGVSTRITAYADPPTVEPHGTGSVHFEVTAADGRAMEAAGRVRMAARGIEVDPVHFSTTRPGSGDAAYYAPRDLPAGEYPVVVSFTGFIEAGLFTGENAMPSEAEVIVTVEGLRTIDIPTPPAPLPEPEPRPEPAPDPPPQRPERYDFWAPMFLVHIVRENTAAGVQEADYWVLHPEPPREDGVVLLADGAGGYFVVIGERHHGPYRSNYEACPAMVQLGIRSALMGARWLEADLEVWGN